MGSSKYGPAGLGSMIELGLPGLPEEVKLNVATLSNFGLAQSTWSGYSTAHRMLLLCQKHVKREMELPISKENTVIFVDWLLRIRGVSAATASVYLAGLRQLHVVRGMDPPKIRSELVNLVLKGKANIENIKKRETGHLRRLPITPEILKLLKTLISRDKGLKNVDKRLVWAVCSLAFAGAFRIHELLCKKTGSFDPDFTLLAEDVSLSQAGGAAAVVHVKLKCPKESKAAACTIVDIYKSDSPLCAVRALVKWKEVAELAQSQPMFRFSSGIPLTGQTLNRLLKKWLQPHLGAAADRLTSHSFRIGLASWMGSKGCTDEQIKQIGRWSSRAFELYTRLPRLNRRKSAKMTANLT